MAKVGRAARVASRQRVEAITASKDIASAETGELYLINSNAAAIVITLPARQDGAYFKFIIGDELTNLDTKTIVVRADAAGNTNGALVGVSTTIKDNGAVTIDGDAKATPGNDHHIFTFNAANSAHKLHSGSGIEVYCDGTNWFLNATLHSDESTTLGKFSG